MLLKRNRIQDSGVGSQNGKHLLSVGGLLLTAYCLLPTAYFLSAEAVHPARMR